MHAGIAGAGIMGTLLAWHLLRAGWQVSLFDPAPEDNCSMTAAGMLAPLAELEKCHELIYQLGMDGLRSEWPALLSELGHKIYFKTSGSLLVAHPDDSSELTRILRKILIRQPDRRQVLAVNVKDYEPELTHLGQGLHLITEGQIDNQHLLTALHADLLANGMQWIKEKIVRISSGVMIDQRETHHFDFVFDCRGLGAKREFPLLRALRGELIWLHATDVHLSHPVRLLHPRYGLYVVPRPNQVYLLGASEIEAEDYSPVSVRTILELLTAAYYLHAGFAEARLIKSAASCRPVLPHHLPEIHAAEGMIAVNGLYRHGYLIAPALAADVMRYLAGGKQAQHYPQIWRDHHDKCLFQ